MLTQDYLWPVSSSSLLFSSPSSLPLVSPFPSPPLANHQIQTIGKYLQSGDYVIAETGTSAYGIPLADLTSKPNVRMISQVVFGSIGWATGTAVGSFVAGQEAQNQSLGIKRNILITGEGSLQLTVQAFSDLIRHELGATMSVLFIPSPPYPPFLPLPSLTPSPPPRHPPTNPFAHLPASSSTTTATRSNA